MAQEERSLSTDKYGAAEKNRYATILHEIGHDYDLNRDVPISATQAFQQAYERDCQIIAAMPQAQREVIYKNYAYYFASDDVGQGRQAQQLDAMEEVAAQAFSVLIGVRERVDRRQDEYNMMHFTLFQNCYNVMMETILDEAPHAQFIPDQKPAQSAPRRASVAAMSS